MRIALLNNGLHEPVLLEEILGAHAVSVFPYSEASKIKSDFDAIVLSGSSQFPIVYSGDVLGPEIELIQTSTTPILGICYGCEIIAMAFGGHLIDMGSKAKVGDTLEIDVRDDDVLFQGRKKFTAYDAHRWAIDEMSNDMKVLATSIHGPEVIRHKQKLIYGLQFHPEKLTDGAEAQFLVHNFLALAGRLKVDFFVNKK